ncbi:MAG: twin-arginine translocase TatA/TatE family subunit [Acidimicrobiaceae bacterium]|nr:twin-arginine translocase TatA/TatE family subunit [Acidimicrobiaceae bacterium]
MVLGEIFGGADPIILIVVIVLLFGAKKLPQLARSLGSASSEFKKGIEEGSKGTESSQSTSIPQSNSTSTPNPQVHQADLEPPQS